MADRLEASDVAESLEEIYETTFGGKKRGRYKISRSDFRQLANRKNLHDSFVYEVSEEALEIGYVVFPLYDDIVVIEEEVIRNYRKVTKKVLKENMDSEED
jgi:hypothetical protein